MDGASAAETPTGARGAPRSAVSTPASASSTRYLSVFREDAPGWLSPARTPPSTPPADRLYRRQVSPSTVPQQRLQGGYGFAARLTDTKRFQVNALRNRIDTLLAENDWLKSELHRLNQEREAQRQKYAAAASDYRHDANEMDNAMSSLRSLC